MNRQQQAFIEQQAEKVIRDTGKWTYPVNVEQIAASLKIDIIPFDFGEDITTALVEKDEKAKVGLGVNTRITDKNHRRLVIAHAIGHFVLGHLKHDLVDNHKNYWSMFEMWVGGLRERRWEEQEREANAFAAALLLPERMMFDYIHVYRKEIPMLKADGLPQAIAKAFKVSVQLVWMRSCTLKRIW